MAGDPEFATTWVGVLEVPYAASARLTTVSSLSMRAYSLVSMCSVCLKIFIIKSTEVD